MHGLKNAIFRNQLSGWIGQALLVQPSKTARGIFFSLLYFNFHFFFLKYETIVRSSTWSFGHSDPDPSSLITKLFFFNSVHLAKTLFSKKIP